MLIIATTILLLHLGIMVIPSHFQIRLNFQLHPTEPANYRGSYTAVSKEIVDIEISLYRHARIVIIGTITVALGTIATIAMKLLLKRTLSERGAFIK
jgi:hypothetical protein